VGRTAGEIIANLTVDPRTTLLAAVLTNTHPSDPQARAAELNAALAAGDADLDVLAQASTALYNAQLDNGIDVAFSSGSESDGSADGGGDGDGGGSGDGGGTGGDAGDGGAFSPLPGAACDFALTLDGPVLRNATLADLLANGILGRPDLQAIIPQVNAAFVGQQAVVVAAFSRLFPTGLGRPISTAADAHGSYFLSTPPGVPGFVRCRPADAAHLVLARFVPARQPGQQLLGQDVTPATTVAALVVAQTLQDGRDPVAVQNAFLAAVAPLQIILPNHPQGNGLFATVQILPGTTLTDPQVALLAFAATTIFDAMRLQQATLPPTITFTEALGDYFQDATFAPQLAPLQSAVDMALDQGQPVLGLGRNDISQATTVILPPPPTITTVTVAPGSVNILLGQTQQFTARVQGTGSFSPAVTWQVNRVAGGNATVGTISTTGLYIAPSTVPRAMPVIVTAVSSVNASKSGTASVIVVPVSAVSASNTLALNRLAQKDIIGARDIFKSITDIVGLDSQASQQEADTARFFYALTRVAALGFPVISYRVHAPSPRLLPQEEKSRTFSKTQSASNLLEP
jgi:hypothetical protein